jgi:ferredoxin
MDTKAPTCILTVWDLEKRPTHLEVPKGSNLRQVLLQNGISPYTTVTRRLNCGGNGICATCGVWIRTEGVPPTHWHDKLAKQFGYPRLSCQVTVDQDMEVELVEKWIWGGRKS